jgi:hypothetical protein
MQNSAIAQVERVYNRDNVHEFLTDMEILKNNKLATNEELASMRAAMIESLKVKGTKDYRATRKAEMLKLKRVAEGLSVSPQSFQKWSDDTFTQSAREAQQEIFLLSKDLDKLNSNKRYNVDAIKKHLGESFDNIMKDEAYANLDSDTILSMKQSI